MDPLNSRRRHRCHYLLPTTEGINSTDGSETDCDVCQQESTLVRGRKSKREKQLKQIGTTEMKEPEL